MARQRNGALASMARELELNAESLVSVLPSLAYRPYVHDRVVSWVYELQESCDKLRSSQDMFDHHYIHAAARRGFDGNLLYLSTRVPKTSQERSRDIEALEAAIPSVMRDQPKELLIALKKELVAEKKRLQVTEAAILVRDMAQ